MTIKINNLENGKRCCYKKLAIKPEYVGNGTIALEPTYKCIIL